MSQASGRLGCDSFRGWESWGPRGEVATDFEEVTGTENELRSLERLDLEI